MRFLADIHTHLELRRSAAAIECPDPSRFEGFSHREAVLMSRWDTLKL
jgi:hypothetical protein